MPPLNFKFPTPAEFLSWLQTTGPDTFHNWDCFTCPLAQMIESTQGVTSSIHPSGMSPGYIHVRPGYANHKMENLPKWANELALNVDVYNDENLSLSKNVVIKYTMEHDKETGSRAVPKGKT